MNAEKAVAELLLPLKGYSAWGAAVEANDFTLQFGEGVPARSGTRPCGEWALTIGCSWRIENARKIIVGHGDYSFAEATARFPTNPLAESNSIALTSNLMAQTSALDDLVNSLNDQKIESTSLVLPGVDLSLHFQGGVTLRTFSTRPQKYLHWYLFTPDHHVLVAGPGTSWSYMQLEDWKEFCSMLKQSYAKQENNN
jgi:hypothetical protein